VTEPSRRWEIEWGKLVICVLLIFCGMSLMMLALFDSNLPDDRFTIAMTTGTALVTGVMGYLFGNGRLASKGEISVPTIRPKTHERELKAFESFLNEQDLNEQD
jgi:hypothetical protein